MDLVPGDELEGIRGMGSVPDHPATEGKMKRLVDHKQAGQKTGRKGADLLPLEWLYRRGVAPSRTPSRKYEFGALNYKEGRKQEDGICC